MKIYYDLHIHTALSPCGDNDMSPMNIVNMAMLKGLDVIAITDHNSIKNCLSCIEISKGKNIIVIPGMEIQTKEEVHLLCLFKNINYALAFSDKINPLMSKESNNSDYFGDQLIFDNRNNVVDREDRLLISSVDISINKVFTMVSELNGVVIPAHIDRRNYSIISNLGFLPMDLNITTVEISKNCNRKDFLNDNKYLDKYNILINSDAHYLGDISEPVNYMDLPNKNIEEIFMFLKSKKVNIKN